MEILDDVVVPVELKYCERCGGLWLRAKEKAEIYCPECAPEMALLPRSRAKRVLVVAVDSIDDIEGCLAELTGMCGEGGNA
jgi:hypothetical protein